MTNIERMEKLGEQTGEAVRLIKFIPSTDNYKALIRFSAIFFEEYTADPNRNYLRGTVLKMPGDDISKYLFTGDGKIQIALPPPINPLCKLFRNGGRFNYVDEEFCERGFERYFEDTNNQQRTGWYRVIVDTVDDKTPPPNAPDRWEKVG